MSRAVSFSLRVRFKKAESAVDPDAAARTLVMGNETIRAGLSGALLEINRLAQRERMTGHGPFPPEEQKLGIVTQNLRRMQHTEPVKATDKGYSGRIGNQVEYFRAHEFGVATTVNVPEHRRRAHTVHKTTTTKTGKTRRKAIYSRLEQTVRAHTVQMRIPARRPLGAAIDQHSKRVIDAAMKSALRKLQEKPV
jgi:hypothetical protein